MALLSAVCISEGDMTLADRSRISYFTFVLLPRISPVISASLCFVLQIFLSKRRKKTELRIDKYIYTSGQMNRCKVKKTKSKVITQHHLISRN